MKRSYHDSQYRKALDDKSKLEELAYAMATKFPSFTLHEMYSFDEADFIKLVDKYVFISRMFEHE